MARHQVKFFFSLRERKSYSRPSNFPCATLSHDGSQQKQKIVDNLPRTHNPSLGSRKVFFFQFFPSGRPLRGINLRFMVGLRQDPNRSVASTHTKFFPETATGGTRKEDRCHSILLLYKRRRRRNFHGDQGSRIKDPNPDIPQISVVFSTILKAP
jgi:hypothetical protein